MKKNKNNLISISPPAPPAESKVPTKYYPNLETYKEKILSENKNKSGIYMLKNNNNGKQYIGSAVNLYNRLSFDFSCKAMKNSLKNSKSSIYNAILKYGYSNFSLTILEYCSPDKCLEREGYYQKTLKPEYNIAKEPGAPMRSRKHSEKTKQIWSEARTGENNPMYGQNHSEETKQIMSEAKKGQSRPEGSGSHPLKFSSNRSY